MNILKRLTSETPTNWVKIRNWSIFGGIILIAIAQTLPTAGLNIPILVTILTAIGGTLTTVGGGMAQLTTNNKTILQEEDDIDVINNNTLFTKKDKRILRRKLRKDNRINN